MPDDRAIIREWLATYYDVQSATREEVRAAAEEILEGGLIITPTVYLAAARLIGVEV